MQLVIGRDGTVRGIYGEEIDLAALGPLDIERASHVEPDSQGRWMADLSPVGGPVLGPFERRSEGLEAEVAWLEENWLGGHALLVSEPFPEVGLAGKAGDGRHVEAAVSTTRPTHDEEGP